MPQFEWGSGGRGFKSRRPDIVTTTLPTVYGLMAFCAVSPICFGYQPGTHAAPKVACFQGACASVINETSCRREPVRFLLLREVQGAAPDSDGRGSICSTRVADFQCRCDSIQRTQSAGSRRRSITGSLRRSALLGGSHEARRHPRRRRERLNRE